MIDYQHQEVIRQIPGKDGLQSAATKPERREPLKEELRDFMSCVTARRRPPVSGIEAMNALDVALRITDLVMDPFDPKTLYAASWDRIRTNRESIVSGPNSKVFKTTDGGATWKPITTVFPTGVNFGRIALGASQKTR